MQYRFFSPCDAKARFFKTLGVSLEKLAALVPPPRARLSHYSDCLTLNSKLRAQAIPSALQWLDGTGETEPA
jgi:hypothetical protein